MAYDNTNTGVLWREQNKKSDKHPDYTGKLDVGGTEYRIAGWIKDGKNGKFLSIRVSGADKPVADSGRATNPERGGGDIDDSVPFAPDR